MDEKRKVWMGFRASREEREAVSSMAEKAHLPVGAWIRMVTLQAAELSRPEARSTADGDEFLEQWMRTLPTRARRALFELGESMRAESSDDDRPPSRTRTGRRRPRP